MGFSTTSFLFVFFPLSIGLYYLALLLEKCLPRLRPLRVHDSWLVVVSVVFYGWASPSYALCFCGYCLVVFCVGRIAARAQGSRRTGISAVSVVVLLSLLFYCKYAEYVLYLLRGWSRVSVPRLSAVAVPLGISFITFSAISYVVDVCRGTAEAGSVLDVFLYLTFFPKVVSGPIMLWKDFSLQAKERSHTSESFLAGVNRMIVGFSKKILLADAFGALVSSIAGNMWSGMDTPTAWGLMLFYGFQIYLDFSAYSDIAIGISRMLGFTVKENFLFPYTSVSITEFWRRWHISLGTWFREYVYIPLGGNRRGLFRTLVNLGVIFLLTGIWHGAGMGYLVWGLLHGLFVVLERCLRGKPFYEKSPKPVRWLFTMFIVMIGWLFFYFGEFSQTVAFLPYLIGKGGGYWVNHSARYYFSRKTLALLAVTVFGSLCLRAPLFAKLRERVRSSKVLFCAQETALLVLLAAAICVMTNSTYSPFIYFQY